MLAADGILASLNMPGRGGAVTPRVAYAAVIRRPRKTAALVVCALLAAAVGVFGILGVATPAVAVTNDRKAEVAAGTLPTAVVSAALPANPHVLLILTDALQWPDISPVRTPHLASWASAGAMFNIAPPNVSGWDCPQDITLAMGAGKQVSARTLSLTPACALGTMRAGGTLFDWQYASAQAASRQADLGQLARVISASGKSYAAIGQQAGVLMATSQGMIPRQWVPAAASSRELAAQVRAAVTAHDFTIVDASSTDFYRDSQRAMAMPNGGILLDNSCDAAQLVGAAAAADAAGSELTRVTPTRPELSPEEVATAQEVKFAQLSNALQRTFYRQDQAAENAQRAEAILAAISPNTAVVFMSLQSFTATGQLQPGFVSYGPAYSPLVAPDNEWYKSLGWSAQVQRPGTVSYLAIVPTALRLLQVPSAGTDFGAGVQPVAVAGEKCSGRDCRTYYSRRGGLLSGAEKASAIRIVRTPFYKVLSWSTIALLALATVWFVAKRRGALALAATARLVNRAARSDSAARSHRVVRRTPPEAARTNWRAKLNRAARGLFIALGLTISAIPLASHLLTAVTPWWKAGNPSVALFTGTWLLAAAIAALSALGLRRHPFLPVAAIATGTAVALLADAVTGSNVMADSPMGFNTLMAARFYGMGNEAFALVAVGAFFGIGGVTAVTLAHGWPRWLVATIAGVLGMIVVVIDVWPKMGADFGGALALVPAVAVYVVLISRARVTVGRVGLALGLGAVAAMSVAVLDWRRPVTSRTHLGNFVQSIIDGEAFEIIWRKISVNLHLLTVSLHRWVVLAGVIFIAVVLVKWFKRQHYGRVRDSVLLTALVAMSVSLVLGFALNDSGIALPGTGVILALPGMLAGVAWNDNAVKETLAVQPEV